MTQPTVGALTTSVRPAEDLAAGLLAGGWHVALVSGAPTLREALDAIGVALNFPDYYGRNLDALVDCLRDLTEPTALVWVGWEPFAVQRPQEWATLVSVLGARSAERDEPAFSVVFSVQTQPGEAELMVDELD